MKEKKLAMEELEIKNIDIVRMYLQKLEQFNDEERRVLIKTIDLINHPMFFASNHL